jgi:hypothetical protein
MGHYILLTMVMAVPEKCRLYIPRKKQSGLVAISILLHDLLNTSETVINSSDVDFNSTLYCRILSNKFMISKSGHRVC